MEHNAKFNLTGELSVELIKKLAAQLEAEAEAPIDAEAPKPTKKVRRSSYVVTGTSEARKARRIRARAKGLV